MQRITVGWRLRIALMVPLVLLVIGAVCFRLIEGDTWTWNDAFYMSAISLTTVGYGETRPLSQEGRVFTIVFLFIGVFVLFYTASEILRYIVSGQLSAVMGKERMERTLSHMNDHVIICGLGRMGRLVCQEFEHHEIPFVIIDRTLETLNDVNYRHGIPLHGDATSDEILKHAGVIRARAIISALPSDADNLYITLSARVLSEKLVIVARAEEEAAIAKLRRVGANHVISPYLIGGHRACQAILKPTVGRFIDMTARHDTDFIIEEMLIEAGSWVCGKTLKETRLHEDYGIVVLTIKSLTGEMVYNPQRDTKLEAGHVLVIVGHRDKMKEVKKLGRAPD